MKLTDTKIKAFRHVAKTQKLFDGGGLYLELQPTGARYWRLKYRIHGREKRLALGVYPEISLKEARDKAHEARKLIAGGVDPSFSRKVAKEAKEESLANSFEAIAREWYSKRPDTPHGRRIFRGIEKDLLPFLARRPVSEITVPEILSVLRKVENRGALDTAHRLLQNSGQIFRYAIATGRATQDPTLALRGALPPLRRRHLASITEPDKVAKLLRAIDHYEGQPITRAALRLAPLVFVRPGELRQAEWTEFNLERAEWNIPASKMKLREAHLVPLSRQALQILIEIQGLTGKSKYVFPSLRSFHRPMSNNTILAALRYMGYDKEQMTGHGFRAMARTILDEVLGIRPDYIEHQLAHAVRDPNGRAYNRTTHLAERRKMMQLWADYLDGLKEGGQVIPFRSREA